MKKLLKLQKTILPIFTKSFFWIISINILKTIDEHTK